MAFPTARIATLASFSSLAACAPETAPVPTPIVAPSPVCGCRDGVHLDYAAWRARRDGLQSASTKSSICPRSFGDLPADGEARIVLVDDARDGDHRSARFAIVSARPWTSPLLEPLRAHLGGLADPLTTGGDRVWLLTLTVRTALAREGRSAARLEFEIGPSMGAAVVTSSIAAWTEAPLDLDALSFAQAAKLDVRLPATIELGRVDGNPVEIELDEGKPAVLDAAHDDADRARFPWLRRLRELAQRGERAPTELFP